jgi:hypothetical protein
MNNFSDTYQSDNTFHQIVIDTRSNVRSVAGQMAGLADAFEATGNAKVSGRLMEMVHRLDESMRILNDGFGDDLDRQVRESTQASHNMVEAAFAVAGVYLDKRGQDA